MKTGVWLSLILMLILSGCNESLRSSAYISGANVIPTTFENPERDQHEVDDDDLSQSSSGQPEDGKENPSRPTKADPSRIIYFAQKIMETEGRKLGTACNFYVHRVLQAAGFAYVVYMANDFDLYAKKYFKTYKAEDFNRDSSDAEEKRLKKYIWDYPERTPFITNWTRSGQHGHIAFVERIGEKLVIYQASLGTKLPRKDLTTPDILLNGFNRRQLTVYSEMTPK